MVKWWIIFGTVAVLIWFFRNAGRTTQPALPPRPQPPARKGGTGPLPPRVQEPQTIQTIEDLKALHLGARQALQDGKADEAMRLIGRLFTEAALGDVKVIVSVLGQSWVQDTKSAKAPIGAAVAVAVEAVGQDDFERAFEAVRVALAEAGAGGEPEPMNGVLLVAGLRVAVGVRASQANEDRFQALVEQASKLLVTPGGQEEAHRLFRQALALIPDPPQSDRDRARRARIAMFIDPPPPAESYDALLERGKALLDTDLPGALAAFEQATQVMPDDGAGWAGRAGVLRSMGRHEEAVSAFDRALALAPHVEGMWYERADSLECLDRLEESLASYDEALKRAPAMAAAWVDRAHVLNRLKRGPEALESVKKGLELDPSNCAGWLNRAEQEFGARQLAEAAASYGQFLATVKPNEFQQFQLRARAQRAVILHHLGKYPDALEALGGLPGLDPHLTWLKGSCQLALGQAEAAHATLGQVPDDHPDVWIERGLCLERLKRAPEALECYEKAPVMSGRRWCHEARHRPDQAPDYYGRAVEALLAEDRVGRGLDRLKGAELAYARKKLGELDPARLAEVEAFDAERRSATRAAT